MIKYELNKFMPVDIDKYTIKHIINKREKNHISSQAILFPKAIISNYKEISKKLKMKPKKLCINFNVIQNLISKNIINIENGENLILEIKESSINLSLVNDKRIIKSHSINKKEETISYIENTANELKYIYYYGAEDEELLSELISKFNLKKISLNTSKIEYKGNEDINKFINNIGLVY